MAKNATLFEPAGAEPLLIEPLVVIDPHGTMLPGPLLPASRRRGGIACLESYGTDSTPAGRVLRRILSRFARDLFLGQ